MIRRPPSSPLFPSTPLSRSQVQLMPRARARPALLANIPAVISGAGSNIHSLESRPDRSNARIDASLEIADRRQLETILANIRKVAGVYDVERVYQVLAPTFQPSASHFYLLRCRNSPLHLSFRTSIPNRTRH